MVAGDAVVDVALHAHSVVGRIACRAADAIVGGVALDTVAYFIAEHTCASSDVAGSCQAVAAHSGAGAGTAVGDVTVDAGGAVLTQLIAEVTLTACSARTASLAVVYRALTLTQHCEGPEDQEQAADGHGVFQHLKWIKLNNMESPLPPV